MTSETDTIVQTILKARIIEAIRRRLSADDMVDGFARVVLKTAADDWRIRVSFGQDE